MVFKIIGIILVIFGLLFVGQKIVEVTKNNPDKGDTELVVEGVAEAGKEAKQTITDIREQLKDNATMNETAGNLTVENVTSE